MAKGAQLALIDHFDRCDARAQLRPLGSTPALQGRLRRRTQRLSGLAREAPCPLPPELNWDLWLGPARNAPTCPRSCSSSGGTTSIFRRLSHDWGAHPSSFFNGARYPHDTGPIAIENVEATVPLRPTFTTPRRRFRSSGFANGTCAFSNPTIAAVSFRGEAASRSS